MLDDDPIGLRAMDHMAGIELHNLLRFEILFELLFDLSLVAEIGLEDILLFGGLYC